MDNSWGVRREEPPEICINVFVIQSLWSNLYWVHLIEASVDSWGEEGRAVNQCHSSKLGEQPQGDGRGSGQLGLQADRLIPPNSPVLPRHPLLAIPGPIYSNHLLISASAPRLQMMLEKSDTWASWHQDSLGRALHTTRQSFHVS